MINNQIITLGQIKGYRFPEEIISHVVYLYHRFMLSLRDVSEIMLQRGVTISHESIREWRCFLAS